MVEGGGWDEPSKSFVDREIPRRVYEYVTTGDATRLGAAIRDRIERGDRPVWGYSDPDAVDARMEEIGRLIESIRREGYCSRRELQRRLDRTLWIDPYRYAPHGTASTGVLIGDRS